MASTAPRVRAALVVVQPGEVRRRYGRDLRWRLELVALKVSKLLSGNHLCPQIHAIKLPRSPSLAAHPALGLVYLLLFTFDQV